MTYGYDSKSGKKEKKETKKKAVALLYDPSNQAPQVVAAGQGVLAEKIIATLCPLSSLSRQKGGSPYEKEKRIETEKPVG